MPLLWLPDAELQALQSIFRIDERVDWAAYDRAKALIRDPVPLPREALVAALDAVDEDVLVR